jgi:HD superfamily phosphohydrolase YqeK
VTDLERELPAWARVSAKRVAHIGRVTALLDEWARGLALPPAEARAWHDAGVFHDALRDAPEHELRDLARDRSDYTTEMLHGPAAAARMAADGETRPELLDAVRFHTVGSPSWGRLGRALYMADYLEPGRKFSRRDRAYLAAQVPHDFDATFRQVLRARLEWSLREGLRLFLAAALLLLLLVLGAATWVLHARQIVRSPLSSVLPRGDGPRAPAGVRIRVQVLNTTRTRGLARRATRVLRDRGFDVVELGTTTPMLDTTLVLDRSGHPEWASTIATVLGPARAVPRPDSSRYLDVTVLLGRAWRPPPHPLDP